MTSNSATIRVIYFTLAWFFVGLGVIGILLPIMPTTPFLIVAAWLFSKSSPRFDKWLHEHRYFGPPLVAWRDQRAISRPAKIMAISLMSMSLLSLPFIVRPPLYVTAGVAAVIIACAIFIATRNEPRQR